MDKKLEKSASITVPEEQGVRSEPVKFMDLQVVERIPTDRAGRDRFSSEVTQQFFFWLTDRLSIEDLNSLKSEVERAPSAAMLYELVAKLPLICSLRINAALDDLIFEQARTIGSRIFASRDVQHRVLEWERDPNGSTLYERLGTQLALRVTPGAKGPLSKNLKPWRNGLITEIKLLRNVLKGKFPQRTIPSKQELLKATLQILGDVDGPYGRLMANRRVLELYMEARPHELQGLVFRSRPTPTTFVDSFMSYSSHRSQEALRQAIANM